MKWDYAARNRAISDSGNNQMKRGKSPRGRWSIPQNITPAGKICWCFNLPDNAEYQAVFWGLMEELTKRYNWGEPLTADSDTVADYWRTIIRDNRECFEAARDMANQGCGNEFDIIYRYDETGLREVSSDNGETWVDDPADPRISGTVIPPPLWLITGGDNRCKGAVTARINTKFAMDEILTNLVDIGITAAVEWVAGVLCVATGGIVCGIIQLIAAFAIVVLQVGSGIIQAALTTAVYDIFECILFCRISQDATFSEANWQGVKSDIVSQLSGDAEFALWHFVHIVGPTGLTNLARMSIDVTADCSDCQCACADPTLGTEGQNLQERTDLGVGWWQVETTLKDEPGCETNGCYFAELYLTGCCQLNEYTMEGCTNAPPGNRLATGCDDTPHTGNYGVGNCLKYVLFRTYEQCIVVFQIVDCPA